VSITAECVTCGPVEVAYFRSRDGRVIHRAECGRRGKTSVEWHYAARVLGNEHDRVLSEVRGIPWLAACSCCMRAAS
jgi:hypothetical protein